MVQQVPVPVDYYLGRDQTQRLEDIVGALAEVLFWVEREVQVRKASDSLRMSCSEILLVGLVSGAEFEGPIKIL